MVERPRLKTNTQIAAPANSVQDFRRTAE